MAWKRGQPARQLAWVKVLERALPLQEMRHRVSPSEDRLLLMPSDLRIWRRQHRRPLTTIFLVDASGSMAATRLAEAKGAVQALLAECYVRRDQVALLSFGGQGVSREPSADAIARGRKKGVDRLAWRWRQSGGRGPSGCDSLGGSVGPAG